MNVDILINFIIHRPREVVRLDPRTDILFYDSTLRITDRVWVGPAIDQDHPFVANDFHPPLNLTNVQRFWDGLNAVQTDVQFSESFVRDAN